MSIKNDMNSPTNTALRATKLQAWINIFSVRNYLRFSKYFWIVITIYPTVLAAQTSWTLPRTEYGHPDFQGIWTNRTQTPLQRPVELGDKKVYTKSEALALEAQARAANEEKFQPLDPLRHKPRVGAEIGQEADANFINLRIDVAQVAGEYRTSLIIDPPDGRLPFKDNDESHDVFGRWQASGAGPFDGPEIRPANERCLQVFTQLPSMRPPSHNANMQFIQTEDYVVLLSEMVHDARIIRLDSDHSESGYSKWMGDSVGYWDDNTLVVHTIGFKNQQSNQWIPSSSELEITERFSRISEDEIVYRYTAVDSEIYSSPFTVEMPLRKMTQDDQIYEYACHEGNYSFSGILAGARRQEIENIEDPAL